MRRGSGSDKRVAGVCRRLVLVAVAAGLVSILPAQGAGAVWTAPTALNTNAASDLGGDYCPQVSTDGAGNWVAVWQSTDDLGGTIGTDGDILVSRSTDNDGTWTSPAVLNTNAATDSGNDEDPQLTTDGAGNWVAVWDSGDDLGGTIGMDKDILVSRSTDNGGTWTSPTALNTNAATDSGDDRPPQVTTDGAGNWVAVWSSTEDLGGTIGTDMDIIVSRSTDNGATWTAPAALNTNAATDSGDDFNLKVTTDGAGNWVAVWGSSENLGGTIGTDCDILVSRSTDNGATWTAPAALNTNADTDTGSDSWPQVTTDGAGNWVAVWESHENLGGTIGTDYDIFVSRSTDNGATWTAPAALNTNAHTDSDDDYAPQVTTDGAGNWVVVWESFEDLGGMIGGDPDILVSRSTDNGATWTAPAALNTNAATDSGYDGYPQVTTDGAGNWVAVWHSHDDLGGIGTDYDILICQPAEPIWTAPATLNTNAASDLGGDVNAGQVTTDGAGNWVAAWQSSENVGGIGTDMDILVSRSTDNGATWTHPPEALNSNAVGDSGNDVSPQVSTDGAGHWVAVWECWDDLGGAIGTDMDILVSRSTDNGATWTLAAWLNSNADSDAGDDRCPQLTTDGAGNWVAVWHSVENLGGIGTDCDILVSRSTDNGVNWTPPAALNTNAHSDSGRDANCRLSTDGAGNCVAVWDSTDSLGGTIGTDADILVSRSTDSGATWTPPDALNSNALGDSGGDAWPQVTTDGSGNWVAVWHSWDDFGGTIGTDDDILVSRSTDNGATWTPAAALNTNARSDSGSDWYPRLTTDGSGNWVAVWESVEDLGGTIGTDYDIVVSRSTDNGAKWTPPEALNTNATTDSGDDQRPQVTTDGSGNWLVAWQSTENLGGTIETDWDILLCQSQFNWNDDEDGDGTPNIDDHDIDGDGLSNSDEWDYDPDGDTVPNYLDTDSDGDGLPDGWEAPNGLDPYDDSGDDGAGGDPDWDGLTNAEEYAIGTDPKDDDSDDDGLGDAVETNTGTYVSPADTGTDPNDPDSDDDGLIDGVETNTGIYVGPTGTGTDPNDEDTDDDGLVDGVETYTGVYVDETDTGTDPFDPDSDDDTYLDGVEVDRGSNPNDPGSIPSWTLYAPWYYESLSDAVSPGGGLADGVLSFVCVRNAADEDNTVQITYMSDVGAEEGPHEVIVGAGEAIAWSPHSEAGGAEMAGIPNASFAAGSVKVDSTHSIVGRVIQVEVRDGTFMSMASQPLVEECESLNDAGRYEVYAPWYYESVSDAMVGGALVDGVLSFVCVRNVTGEDNTLQITYLSGVGAEEGPHEVIVGPGDAIAWSPYSDAGAAEKPGIPNASFGAGSVKVESTHPVVGRIIQVDVRDGSFVSMASQPLVEK